MKPAKLTRFLLVGLAAVISIAIVATYSFRSFVSDARNGADPATTYRAYHLNALGDITIEGCKIRLAEPWFPRLESYQTLDIRGREVAFINVEQPTVNGKPVGVSFISHSKRFPSEMLESPLSFGTLSVQFVRQQADAKPGREYAWIPNHDIYVASSTREAISSAIEKTRISCESRVPPAK